MKRSVAHRLDRFYHADHHSFFVDFRMTHVYVKYLRTGAYLTERLSKDIVDIIINKRLLE